MRKNIDERLLTKLKLLAAFEEISVKAVMENAVSFYIADKEKDRLKSLSDEEKEDLGLLLLMPQSDRNDVVSRANIMNALD